MPARYAQAIIHPSSDSAGRLTAYWDGRFNWLVGGHLSGIVEWSVCLDEVLIRNCFHLIIFRVYLRYIFFGNYNCFDIALLVIFRGWAVTFVINYICHELFSTLR